MRLAVSTLMCLGGLSTAWANEPPSGPAAAPTNPPAPTATAQSQPAPSSAPSTAPAISPTAAATTSKPEGAPVATPAGAAPSKSQELTDDEKNLLSHGYKLEIKDGRKYFCHTETPLGTRFPTKVCRTAEYMASVRQHSKDYMNDVQRPSGNKPGQ